MDTHNAHVGDWIEVNTVGGGPSRRGQITEILGAEGHQHFRVRWDEAHETLHYPAEGTRVLRETPEGTLIPGDEGP